MRNFILTPFLIIFWIGAARSAVGQTPPTCSLLKTSFKGWHAYRLTNGLVALTVTPDLGGRAIQYELGSHGYFFVNAELAGKVLPRDQNDRGHAWANYGGDKDWLGPQGFDTTDQWAGPPDYNIDGSAYSAEIVKESAEEVALYLTSPPDDRSGLVLSRIYHLERGSTRVRVEHFMKNVSGHDVRWGFQEVTQSDTAEPDQPTKPNPNFWVYCPTNARSRYPKGFIPQYGEVTHPAYHVRSDRLFGLHYVYQVAQVGLDSEAGWLAVWNGKTQHAFVQRFRYVPGASYPDDCTVEFYLNGPGRHTQLDVAGPTPANPRVTPYYLETEIISPYIALKPGGEGSFETEWFATRGSHPVMNVSDAGITCEPLSARAVGSTTTLAGTFGVFYPGEAVISFKSRSGEELRALSLGRVAPEQSLRLDRRIEVPAGTWRISLSVRDPQGRDRGELGNVTLEEE